MGWAREGALGTKPRPGGGGKAVLDDEVGGAGGRGIATLPGGKGSEGVAGGRGFVL